MGVVPNLATGVWTGADDRATHFEEITQGQGATMSLPTWALYMKKCYADSTLVLSQEDFQRPAHIATEFDCSSKASIDDLENVLSEEYTEEETDF